MSYSLPSGDTEMGHYSGQSDYQQFPNFDHAYTQHSQSGFYPETQYYNHSLAQHQPVVNEPVITHTQSYPPLLTELRNTMQALEAHLAATHLVAEDAKATATQLHDAQVAKDSATVKSKHKHDTKRARTQALVRSKMAWALGLGVNVDGDQIKLLPDSLQHNEHPELLADGKTEKAHPNWGSGVTDPYNARFCARIAAQTMDHISRDQATAMSFYGQPKESEVLTMSKQYFKNLRKTYAAQTTEAGRLRHRKKLALNKRRSRKKEKALDHRQAVKKFREIHGEANTVGDYDAIQTDDMSSDHSDCGKVPKAEFEAHRKQAGGGDHGWEGRAKKWCSHKLRLFHAHLKTIHRQMLADQIELGEDGSTAGKRRVPRFKGMPANDNLLAPGLIRKKPLYEPMVSEAWMKATKNTYKTVPAHLTLFQLELTTTGLHEAELEYFADDDSE
ncbi:hypothetical protein B0H16DRAFT_1465562 [Mycena metata]|uniref:Uncharacterized protein n=1 Tax=Mycena metata TaxID=1033252 RepID=A0AAD7IAY7_9AGAR|nr:hypothetical protein B0H16DRAFT_1465562 [Mycena metata]